jgi:Mg2+/Co2+ transporter CorC
MRYDAISLYFVNRVVQHIPKTFEKIKIIINNYKIFKADSKNIRLT